MIVPTSVEHTPRPTPYPRDPHLARHGRHRPENIIGTPLLAAGLIGDPEHYQRVARWAQTHARAGS